VGADPPCFPGRPTPLGQRETVRISRPTSDSTQAVPPGYWRRHFRGGDPTQHRKPQAVQSSSPQPDAREGQSQQSGLSGVADGFVVPAKPSSAGGNFGFEEASKQLFGEVHPPERVRPAHPPLVHQNRRLPIRYERRPEIHQALLTLACIKICASEFFTGLS
jgi:hypothetical protein